MSRPTETLDSPSSPLESRPVLGVAGVFGPARAVGRLAVSRELVLGREPSCGLWLDDDSVSRGHAALSPTPTGLRVRDLGSRNGVFVGGARVVGEADAEIGASIRVGRSLLVVVRDADATTKEPEGELVGGVSLEALRARVRQLAPLALHLLVRGESGTGKELVARRLHELSHRRGELVAVNCAAIPESLVESELFGHARGAYSGADRVRRGLVARADGGTLFLDELAELPLEAQAKLLRVLEDGVVRPVGEDRGVQVDLRVIGASLNDLAQRVEEGRFRIDLYHRIAAATLEVPPLRARIEDVPRLVDRFADDVPFDLLAMEALLRHRWPGNVRELRNVVTVAVGIVRGEGRALVELRDLPALEATRPPIRRDEERARIEDALRAHGGNVTAAARALGMRRAGIYEEIRRLGIDPKLFRE
jgi:DNA-binding NtrC family response regulator